MGPVIDVDGLSGDRTSIATARRLVRAIVSFYAAADADAAELLTDELLSNAVTHGGGRFRLAAHVEDDRLRVEVTDGEPNAPVVPAAPGHLLDAGRGLTIVQGLASSWGVSRNPYDKQIWFEMNLGQPPA